MESRAHGNGDDDAQSTYLCFYPPLGQDRVQSRAEPHLAAVEPKSTYLCVYIVPTPMHSRWVALALALALAQAQSQPVDRPLVQYNTGQDNVYLPTLRIYRACSSTSPARSTG